MSHLIHHSLVVCCKSCRPGAIDGTTLKNLITAKEKQSSVFAHVQSLGHSPCPWAEE